jgi:hypothetical protein
MVNRVHQFRDRDLKRIVKSTEAATGKSVRRVEVNPRTGNVVVEVGETAASNSWDEVLNAEDPKRPA